MEESQEYVEFMRVVLKELKNRHPEWDEYMVFGTASDMWDISLDNPRVKASMNARAKKAEEGITKARAEENRRAEESNRNRFIRETIRDLEKNRPELSHSDRFRLATDLWRSHFQLEPDKVGFSGEIP